VREKEGGKSSIEKLLTSPKKNSETKHPGKKKLLTRWSSESCWVKSHHRNLFFLAGRRDLHVSVVHEIKFSSGNSVLGVGEGVDEGPDDVLDIALGGSELSTCGDVIGAPKNSWEGLAKKKIVLKNKLKFHTKIYQIVKIISEI
jgi:hypothetical protein